jgi:hypothetical protein
MPPDLAALRRRIAGSAASTAPSCAFRSATRAAFGANPKVTAQGAPLPLQPAAAAPAVAGFFAFIDAATLAGGGSIAGRLSPMTCAAMVR